jgi:hypothetical protein
MAAAHASWSDLPDDAAHPLAYYIRQGFALLAKQF